MKILVKSDPKAVAAVKAKSGKLGIEIKPLSHDPNEAVVRIKAAKLEEALKAGGSLGAAICRGVVFTKSGFMARVTKEGLAKARKELDPEDERFTGCEDIRGDRRFTIQGIQRGYTKQEIQDVFAKYEWRMVPLKGLRDKNNPETTFWTATADNDPKVRFFCFNGCKVVVNKVGGGRNKNKQMTKEIPPHVIHTKLIMW